MTVHPFASTVALAVVVILLCAGCSRQPGTGAVTSAAASPSNPTEAATPLLPSIEPSDVAPPSIGESSFAPTAALVVEPAMPEPPAASIAVDGGEPVVGELGSFTWKNSGSDGPWVPGTPIRVGSGEQLTLTLASAVRLVNWTVSRTPAATFGSGVVGMGDGSADPVMFSAPPRGTWSVNVNVWFADNLGSASYYWLMTVD